ncbi:MAG: DUF5057 domain-containing protein, partial [Lachnospiraceae bacterium]|nr:DUF5057 domain-containing protein [Lachnospiraceae bacterium]
IVQSGKQAYAKETLQGVETIINNNGTNNPYVILEVVPEKNDAAMGYLVGGEEPIHQAKALNDIPNKDLRTQYMNAFTVSGCSIPTAFGEDASQYPLNIQEGSYQEPGDASRSFDLKGSFEEDPDGEYVSLFHEATYSQVSGNAVSGNAIYYEKYYEFENNTDSGDRYKIKLSEVTQVERTFTTTADTEKFNQSEEYHTLNKYFLHENWSGEGVGEITDNAILDSNVGAVLYRKSFDYTYEYFGRVLEGSISTTISENTVTETIRYINATDGSFYVFRNELNGSTIKSENDTDITVSDLNTETTDELRIVELEENADAGNYVVSSITPITGDAIYGYLPFEHYEENEEGHYIRDTEALSEYALYDSSYGTDYTRYNWITNYSYSSASTIYYQGGFTNHEWLKQNVFDLNAEECKDFILDVQTVTMDELNQYDLSKVAMVYFAGENYQNDISKEKVVEIKKLMETNNLPVIFNRSAYLMSVDGESPNLEKLGVVLQQSNLTTVTAANINSSWTDAAYWSTLKGSMKATDITYGTSYVNQSVYVYDDSDFNSGDTQAAIPFVHTDFLTKMSDSQVQYGFAEVKSEIENENFFLSIAGKEERISTDISKAAAMRYIINYGNQRNVIKSKISVLEIEPCNSKKTSNADSDLETYYEDDELKKVRTGTTSILEVNTIERQELLTKKIIAEKWAKQFDDTDKIDNIKLTITHTGEFVGKIEDLNENYDLIYLGLDTSTMNTEITGSSTYKTKTENTVFNDTSMNGLVYYHVGDLLQTSHSFFKGLLYPEDASRESGVQQYRMSGNDITLDKYNDLVDYVSAGYPIIFADGFYNVDNGIYSVNTAKIDRASYMYKIAQYVLEHQIAGHTMLGENVFTESMLDADTTGNGALSKLAQYLNLSKLALTATYVPEPYNIDGTNTQYLSKTDGNYVLRYDIALKNDAAVSLSDTKYDCNLYIDKSVDGRYSSDEEIGNLNIYELKNGTYVQVYPNSSGKYELTAGRYYKVLRSVPNGYVGVLPWKLQFVQNDNTKVRKSLTGYTAVPIPTTTKKTIKVLNITQNDDKSTRLDLKSTAMQNLFSQVKDFNIEIDVVSANEYMNIVREETLRTGFSINAYSSYLNQYQMLIIGFWDFFDIEKGYNLQDEAGVWAIRQYISEGRSVLFTHDTVSFNYYSTSMPYWFNLFIRDSVGMDRYGSMTRTNINLFDIIPDANKTAKTIDYTFLPTKYDIAWKPGMTTNEQLTDQNRYDYTYRNNQGYTDFELLRHAYWNNTDGVWNSNKYTFTSLPFGSYDIYNGSRIMVNKTNEGQITEYPFKIPDSFEVANTHGQYMQLNLDTDSRDSYTNDDIVVWYTISNVFSSTSDSNDYYQASLNNARNNYYIYNRGNVTYSGVGHSQVNNDTERKLFINTMVAAYNAGISPPTVLYKENSDAAAGTIDKIYLPYDSGNGAVSFLENNAEIYFDVVDTNIKYGTKTINADYYIQVNAGGTGIVEKIIDGSTVYLKKIEPSVKKVRTSEVVSNIHALEDGTRYSFNLTKDDLSLTSKNSAYVWIFTDVTYQRTGENGIVIKESSAPGFSKMEIVNLELFDME